MCAGSIHPLPGLEFQCTEVRDAIVAVKRKIFALTPLHVRIDIGLIGILVLFGMMFMIVVVRRRSFLLLIGGCQYRFGSEKT